MLGREYCSCIDNPHCDVQRFLAKRRRWLDGAGEHATAVLEIAKAVLQFEASRYGPHLANHAHK